MKKKTKNIDLKNIKVEPRVFNKLARFVKKKHGRIYGHMGTETARFIVEGIEREKGVK